MKGKKTGRSDSLPGEVRMKVILSRKGFDSSYGGCPSPVLEDGTMVSMPIPDEGGNCRFDDIVLPNGRTYADTWKDLAPRVIHTDFCHLDPDIRKEARQVCPAGWRPAFGQRNAAEGHLENKEVGVGDLFLFFGLFRKARFAGGRMAFVPGEKPAHMIFGWLQIGEIVRGRDVLRFPWHPHADSEHVLGGGNNTIYAAADRLVIGDADTGLPGAGMFPFSEKRVLTVPGMSQVSRWKLNGVFGKVPLSYHYDLSRVKDEYFQSVAKGQEFVFDEDPLVTAWVTELFE